MRRPTGRKRPTPRQRLDPAVLAEMDAIERAAEERTVTDVVADIRADVTDPRGITPEDRRRCVEYLGVEGLSITEIAQLMKRSGRTIARDRVQIQQANALVATPELADRMAGQLNAEAQTCQARIRRVTRDRDTPSAVKVVGERACFDIQNRLVERLQSLGYLPTVSQRIEADLRHRSETVPGYNELAVEVERLKTIALADGDEDTVSGLAMLHDTVARAQLTVRLDDVASRLGKDANDDNAA